MKIAAGFLPEGQVEMYNNHDVRVTYRQRPSMPTQDIDGTFWVGPQGQWAVIDRHEGMITRDQIVEVDFYRLPGVREYSSMPAPDRERVLAEALRAGQEARAPRRF